MARERSKTVANDGVVEKRSLPTPNLNVPMPEVKPPRNSTGSGGQSGQAGQSHKGNQAAAGSENQPQQKK
jgi:hypothetical protein